MKLFTKDIDKKLFAQYPKGSNLEDQMVVAKIFNPYGRGTWYILNSDPEDPDYLWAIVDLMDVEMGSVSRSELENIKVPPFRLGLERDIYFDPINAKEVYDGLMKGERFEKGGEIKKGDYVIVDNPLWKASMGMDKPVRRKVSMVMEDEIFFVDGSNSQKKYVKKMEEGGEIENEQSENKQMLLNRAEGFEHHAEELEAAAKKADHIPAWVVAKAERASSDLSDITHYLDGENEQKREMEEGEEKYAEGGEIKSFDVTFYKAIKRRDGEKVEILRDREDYKGSLDQVMSKALSDFQPMDEYANIKENGKEGIVAKVKVDGSAKIFSKNYGHEVGEVKVEKIVEEKKEEEKEPKKKLFGIFKKGGGIYSSDEMYKVSVHKDGEKKEEVMVRARNEKEASEMFEDTYESKMFEKYGDDIHVEIEKAMSKGGEMESGQDLEKIKKDAKKLSKIHGKIYLLQRQAGGHKGEYVLAKEDDLMDEMYGIHQSSFVQLFGNGKAYEDGGMMEKGGVTGDVHSLTDKLLSQKIQIFIDKVKPIKYYYIDEKSNSLVVGLDGNYTQDAADKFHKEATSSMEFFDADSVDMEYMPKTKDTQYRIKLKKPVKFDSGGMMAKGGKIYKIQVKDSHDIKPKWEDDKWHTGGKKYLSYKDATQEAKKLQGDTAYSFKKFKVVEDVDKMASGGMMAKGGETKKQEKWIQKAIHPKKKGALREEAKRLGLIKGDEKLSMDVLKKLEAKGGKTAQRARLAMKLKQFAGGGEMEMGGKVKFEDKVKSVKKSLLERKKVPKRLEKDYGKTYDPKEAEDAAKRIVGAQTYRERLEARLKKAKKK